MPGRGKSSPTYSRSRSRSFSRSRSRSPRRRSRSRSGMSPPPRRGRRNFSARDNPEPSRCLGVFGLNLRTRERDLFDVFNRYGEIEDITLVFDKVSGESRGFGFVYFRHMEEALTAKEACHGMELHGRPMRVDFSVTERAHTPTPGIYMGDTSRRTKPSYSSRRDDRDRRPPPPSRHHRYEGERSPSPHYERYAPRQYAGRYSRSPSGGGGGYSRRY